MEKEFVCDHCFDNIDEIGFILDYWYLAKINNEYVLFCGQGHKGDILINFGDKLFIEPYFGMKDEEINALSKDDPKHKEFGEWDKLCSKVE